jgi:hypothetical protein
VLNAQQFVAPPISQRRYMFVIAWARHSHTVALFLRGALWIRRRAIRSTRSRPNFTGDADGRQSEPMLFGHARMKNLLDVDRRDHPRMSPAVIWECAGILEREARLGAGYDIAGVEGAAVRDVVMR